MIVCEKTKKKIKLLFFKMQTREDLLNLINISSKELHGERAYLFDLRALSYYSNYKLSNNRYWSFLIKKKSGGNRKIHSPTRNLKILLQILNYILQCVSEPNAVANGFVLGKSVVTNANTHVGRKYVYNIDLQDFFHSFDVNRVKMGFYLPPYNMNGSKESLAYFIACLVTHPFEINGEIKNVLPQGSPTSPTITNILCLNLDRRLNGLAKRFKMNYSRYADDITFSSDVNLYDNAEFQRELKRIIEEDQRLKINPEKTRLQSFKYQQEVTGIIVNEKLNVRKRYVKQIRMWLYYWEKYGYEKAQDIFMRDYFKDKGHLMKGKPNIENVLSGKLNYLKMVKGDDDSTYQILKKRFDRLIKISEEKQSANVEMETIVDAIINKGFEKGILLYDKLKST